MGIKNTPYFVHILKSSKTLRFLSSRFLSIEFFPQTLFPFYTGGRLTLNAHE